MSVVLVIAIDDKMCTKIMNLNNGSSDYKFRESNDQKVNHTIAMVT